MSDFFEWNPAKLNLDIQQMDDEHRVIVDCMNRLHKFHEGQAGRALQASALEKLVRVTIDHFAEEEAYMEKLGFPGRDRHGVIHKQLLERMEHFHQQFRAGGALTEEFFNFLKMWLKAYICGIDTKYAAHARAA